MSPVSSLGRDSVEIDRVALQCGIAECQPPRFDPETPEHQRSLLVQVRGFSCNYRDKGFTYMMKFFPQTRRLPIGSEFVAEVVAGGEVGAGGRKILLRLRVLLQQPPKDFIIQ